MKGIMYWHPKLYELFMRILCGKTFEERYKILAKEINGMGVIDLGCGDCYITKYLDKNKYIGFDINKIFIRYAKRKGIRAEVKDVMKEKLPQADCVIISEILHQVYPNHEELIKQALKSARKKVIIREPTKHVASSNNFFVKWIARKINDPGYGSPKERLNKDDLFKLYKNYKVKKIFEIGRDSYAIFEI